MILAGDIGGTKVHLALYSFDDGKLHSVREQKFPAGDYPSLEAIVQAFLGTGTEPRNEIAAACFGCPGPVRAGRLKLTNLPWVLDVHDLSKALGIEHIFLINDLEANGYGIPELRAESIYTLAQADTSAVGHRGLMSAGTGLGEALLIWDGKQHHIPVPSEGGHGDFAPRTDREVELLQYLRHTLNGRVSYERVVSGLGLQNVYGFFRDQVRIDEPQWLKDRLATEDCNAVIGGCAENGSSEICVETMNLFCAVFGAEAGNIALKVLATGGMYLGGGIAPKILPLLRNGLFMEAFVDKGRLRPLLEAIPVRVILDDTCALLGAAAFAEARASEVSGRSERAASTALTGSSLPVPFLAQS